MDRAKKVVLVAGRGRPAILPFLAALAATLALASVAAADSRVKGKVVDSQGQPVAEAVVKLTDSSSGRGYTARTGKDGGFFQRGVLPATYTLQVEREGYTTHIIEDVKVQAGGERSFEIKLRTIAERQKEQLKESGLEGYATGSEAFRSGEFEKALASADKAIQDRPEDAKGYDLKAKTLISLKRYAEAIPLLEKELTLANPAPDARTVLTATVYNAGVVASRGEKTDEAIQWWLKAIELGHEEPMVHRLLGDAFLAKEDYGRAREQLETYLSRAPGAKDEAEVRLLLGEIQKLEAKK